VRPRGVVSDRLPRSVPLLGPDVVLLAMAALGGGPAANGTPSSNAVLALELAGVVERARVETALARLLALCPWVGGRLVRPRPWGRLCWRVPRQGPTPPPIASTTLADDGANALGSLVDRELAATIDPRRAPPLRLTLATDGVRTHLVLTWAHALMDPHGSEHLVRLLAALDEGGADALATREPVVVAPPDTRPLRERGALATKSVAQLRALAPVPPVSLAARPHATAPHGPRHWRFRFAAAVAPTDRLRRGMPWRLAVVATAMRALFAERGVATDVPFLVPVSVNRRPRGEHGPVLGNYLAFHFARARFSSDADPAPLARTLRDQLADAVRNDELEAAWAGLAFARWRPLRGIFRELPWTKAGDFCSFHFADTDALLPDRTHLFGAPLVGGYHVAVVPARPGAGVFFGRRDEVQSLVVSTTDGALDDADTHRIADVVADAMGWRPLD
jgi:hypothetical protein